MSSRSEWQLPPGVPQGVWDYASADFIAADYEDFFRGHALMEFDLQVVRKWLAKPGFVVDFGCGPGRALKPLADAGHQVMGIDLSHPMLCRARQSVAGKAGFVRANLADLDCIGSEVADYALCLFSTLGMIQGSQHRLRFLRHAARILKRDGRFVLHVHNRWFNLRDPQGPWRIVGDLLQMARRRPPGERHCDYRGIRNFYLHVFAKSELRRLLSDAGFRIAQWLPLRPNGAGRLACRRLLESIRASGWIVVCENSRSGG